MFAFPHPSAVSRPIDGSAVLAGAAARQAATPTALAQARLSARVGAPVEGAFAREVARAFTGWKHR